MFKDEIGIELNYFAGLLVFLVWLWDQYMLSTKMTKTSLNNDKALVVKEKHSKTNSHIFTLRLF